MLHCGMRAAAEHTDAAPTRAAITWALLGLVIERPSYGYELAKRFERVYGEVLAISSTSYIYTVLKKLEQRTFVEEVSGRGGGRQPKPRYHATPTGIQAYQQQLVSELDDERRRSSLFVRKLAVFAHEPEVALGVLSRYRDECLRALKNMPLRTVSEASTERASGLAARLETEEGRMVIEAKLLWLDFAQREFARLAAEMTGP